MKAQRGICRPGDAMIWVEGVLRGHGCVEILTFIGLIALLDSAILTKVNTVMILMDDRDERCQGQARFEVCPRLAVSHSRTHILTDTHTHTQTDSLAAHRLPVLLACRST